VTGPGRRRQLPLSVTQERLWFLDQLSPGSAAHHVPAAIRLRGPLSLPALEASLTELVRRHEALRTSFPLVDGSPVQQVHPFRPPSIPVHDLSGAPEAERAEQLAGLVDDAVLRPFDLEARPPWRAWLARLGPEDHALILCLHHVIVDAGSLRLLFGELAALYTAALAGSPAELPQPRSQFGDFATRQREATALGLKSDLAYWTAQLAGAPQVVALPTAGPALRTPPPADLCTFAVPDEAAGALLRLGSRSRATPFMTLLAGFQLLLHRLTWQDDLLLGVPVSLRPAGFDDVVGCFTNMVVLRSRFRASATFPELLDQTRQTVLEAFEHQALPFELLVEELRPRRDLAHAPLIQVTFNMFDRAEETLLLPGLSVAFVRPPPRSAEFDLAVSIEATRDGLAGAIEFRTDLFDEAAVAGLAGRYTRLLAAAGAQPERAVGDLPILTPQEAAGLAEANRTRVDFGGQRTLVSLLRGQLARTPDAVAASGAGGDLTYRELHRRANRLARRLHRLGVGPERVVGICARPGVAMVVGVLGVLGCGGAFLQLDPDLPPRRLGVMAENAGIQVLLAEQELLDLVPGAGRTREALEHAGTGGDGDPPAVAIDERSLAYMIYTSGSTGEPKGVMIEHRAIANRLLAGKSAWPLAPRDRALQTAAPGFDPSVWQMLWPLVSGGRVVLPEPGGHRDPAHLRDLVEEMGVTVLHCTPSLLDVFLAEVERRPAGAGLRRILCGGEALSPDVRDRCLALLPAAELHNLYGPAESAVDVCHHRCVRGEPASTVPIGRPIANVRLHVLDERLGPVPEPAAGELCIGGDGLGRGYLGRPGLTAERFVPDPSPDRPGTRIYRTGDLARRQLGGELAFGGRLDHQVKVRGVRVELGEVETVLERHPEVRRAAALLGDDGGDQRLVAYIVAEDAGVGLEARLRAFLADRLPAAMVPAVFVRMSELPVTPNHKLDRGALPPPEATELDPVTAGPLSQMEDLLAGIWAELLGARPAPGAQFFEQGGHSLLAIRLVALVRLRLGTELSVRDVFEHPGLHEMAAAVERRLLDLDVAPPVEPAPRSDTAPLSFAQERLWFLHQLVPERPVYNVAVLVELAEPVERTLLERALGEVVCRHEVLRTAFTSSGTTPVQVVLAPLPPAVEECDLGACGEPETRLGEVARTAARRLFDLESGQVLRAVLVRLPAGGTRLLLVAHHIAVDGWSIDVLLRELAECVAAMRAGRQPNLPALPVQYADYALWQRRWADSDVAASRLDHWVERLQGAPAVLELTGDRPRPPVQSFAGGQVELALPAELAAACEALARGEGTTMFMTLLLALQLLLWRTTGQPDVVVGAPVAGRERHELTDLVGMFANSLALRLRVDGAMSTRQLLARVRDVALDAYANQDVPLERVVERLGLDRSASHSPLFQVLFAYEQAAAPPAGGLFGDVRPVHTGTSKFDLTLYVRRGPGGLDASVEFASDLFDEPTVGQLLAGFAVLLGEMAARPDVPVAGLSLVTAAERDWLVHGLNATAAECPRDCCLHQLVEEQAARTPARTAVVQDGGALTYAELDLLATRLALRLARLGVGPESLVPVLVERSAELVVALLSVWKAGAASVPLDAETPPARLESTLRDVRPQVVLTEAALRGALPAGVAALVVDDPEPDASVAGDDWPPGPPDVRGAACLLYTSGSTGRPRGVLLTHEGLVNVVHQRNVVHGLSESDRVLHNFSIAFDPSIWQVFGPLLVGATVVLPARGRHRDLDHVLAVIERHGVTIVDSTPSLLAGWLDLPAFDRAFRRVRTVFCGGEALPTRLANAFLERTGCGLTNIYGITEACVDVTSWRCRPGGRSARVPVGRPVANKRVHLLDRGLSPVRPGTHGELYVGGVGVARAYHGLAALTAERFVPDPFGDEPGGRLYRTGDRGRRLADGTLEFLGRVDDQVKVRGYRVEPGEIEAALRLHPSVADVAVVAREAPSGAARLIAYLVPRGVEPGARELHRHLRGLLPFHMIPSGFAMVPAIPLTEHGKVDRRRLPDPAPIAAVRPSAPAGVVEEAVAAIWREVLGVESVHADDNFFELGGNSLLATVIVSRIAREMRVTISMQRLFDDPTVAGAAAAMAELTDQADMGEPLG
jgi:amino acid adenylation domain-containing protein